MRKGACQQVTGIVVNKKLSISRQKLRQFRALLHNLEHKPGFLPAWGRNNSTAAILGYANFVKMVKPAQGAAFQQQIVALLQTNRLQYPVSETTTPKNTPTPPAQNNSNEPKKDDDKPWWNVV